MAKPKSKKSATSGASQQPLDKIASALDSIAKTMALRLERDFPQHEAKPMEINRPDEERRRELGDKAEPEWFVETEKALPESRFQKRFKAAQK